MMSPDERLADGGVPAGVLKLFVTDMVERRFGYVLLVASIGAYQPSPTYAM